MIALSLQAEKEREWQRFYDDYEDPDWIAEEYDAPISRMRS
jgi:hypothetical protein